MRTATVLLLMVVLLVGALPLPALAAVPVADLMALAAYMPADTALYVGVRTDDAFIGELDGLIGAIINRLPPAASPGPFSLRAALDAGIGDLMPGGTFQSAVRNWLGDTAALGVVSLDTQFDDDPSNDEDVPVIFAVAVTDRAALEAFIERVAGGRVEVTTAGSYTVFRSTVEGEEGVIMVGDSVALMPIFVPVEVMVSGFASTLAEDEAFTGAFQPLPEDAYNVLVYVEGTVIAAAQRRELRGLVGRAQRLNALAGAAPSDVAIGFTTLDGRVLTMDVAVQMDLEAMAGAGLTLPSTTPVDFAFARHIPAEAQYVIHATDLWSGYQALLQNIRAIAEMQGDDPDEFDSGLNFVMLAIKGALGLDLEEDVLSWMTGDFALFLSGDRAFFDRIYDDPVAAMALETLPVDFGFVVEATDPAAARNVFAQLSDTLPALLADAPDVQATVTQEAIGDGNALVLHFPVEEAEVALESLDILIGVSGDVLAIGTRGAVTAALVPGDGLRRTPGFAAASEYLLPGPTSVWYVSNEGVDVLADLVILTMVGPTMGDVFEEILESLESPTPSTPTPEERAERQRQREEQQRRMFATMRGPRAQVLDALSLIENLTISTAVLDDGTSLARATIALALE